MELPPSEIQQPPTAPVTTKKYLLIFIAIGLLALVCGTAIAFLINQKGGNVPVVGVAESEKISIDSNNLCIPLTDAIGIQTDLPNEKYEYSVDEGRGVSVIGTDGQNDFFVHYGNNAELAVTDSTTKSGILESLKASPQFKTANAYAVYENKTPGFIFNIKIADFQPLFLSNNNLITQPFETNKDFFFLEFFADPANHAFLKNLLTSSKIQKCLPVAVRPVAIAPVQTPKNPSNNLCIPFSKKFGVQTALPKTKYKFTVSESDYGYFQIADANGPKFSFLSIPAQWDMAGFKKSYEFDTRKPVFRTANGYSVRDMLDGKVSEFVSAYILSNEDLLKEPYETSKDFFVLNFSSDARDSNSEEDRAKETQNVQFLREQMPLITIEQCAEPYDPKAHTPSALLKSGMM